MSPQRHAALGMFFLVVVGVLGYFTLFKTDFSIGEEKYEMTAWFPDANGLRKGDAVRVAGVRWGKVSQLIYDPVTTDLSHRIRVDVILDNKVDLFADHQIMVRNSSILGGKVLNIEPGMPGTGPRTPGDLLGSVENDAVAALGKMVEENRETLKTAISEASLLIEEARTGDGLLGALIGDPELRDEVKSTVTSIKSTFDGIDSVIEDAQAGKGTLGKLLTDDTLYNDIQKLSTDLASAAADARLLFKDAREGEGVIGMLINDKELAARTRTAVDDIAEITRGLRAGEGTIGSLLKDSAVADNLKEITASLTSSEGTLGALINDREVYDKVLAIANDIKAFSDALANGEGTIAKLLNDDEIYVELRKALRTLTGTLEEAREAAPISAFLQAFAVGF
ncbi:MAG: phospholipid/cholesterol/gamma-HCH transport system substrate-binding protein [Planctomycetota bacterium]|jgi:phospholipid/cholesterol/gamma-HCH transport system substrate-binding protein